MPDRSGIWVSCLPDYVHNDMASSKKVVQEGWGLMELLRLIDDADCEAYAGLCDTTYEPDKCVYNDIVSPPSTCAVYVRPAGDPTCPD